MIKLIALDLDGTLMSPDHVTVSKENKAALKEAHDAGAKIAVATGRTLSIFGDVCEQVPEIDYILYSNGAAVYDRREQRVLHEHALDRTTCTQLLDFLDGFPAFLELYAGGQSYAQKDKEGFFPFDVFPKDFIEQARAGMVAVDDFRSVLQTRSAEKLTVYLTDKAQYRAVWDALIGRKDLAVTTSFPISIDLTRAGADKGTALQALCRHLGVSPEQCMAFGDAENDFPMLRFAFYGYAMANGSDACKQAASFVTKSNAEDGVAVAVRQVMQLSRTASLKFFDNLE